MIRVKHLLVLLCLALSLEGCAHHSALSKGQEAIDLSSSSIALLSVRISNQNKPDYQPFPFMVFMGGASSDTFQFDADGPHRSEPKQFNEYLLSFNLKEGVHSIDTIWFDYHGTFIGARATIPLHLKAEIKPGSVTYLGHLDVVIRPKKSNDEESAGSKLPMINQATAGFSNGSYDIVVEDRFDKDMEWFVSEYPALKKVKVEKSILPPWTRPAKAKPE